MPTKHQDSCLLIHHNESFNNNLLDKAVRLAQQGDRPAAVPLLKRLVDDGESIANCYLGMIYEYGGYGVSENFEYARFYYEKALEDGWVPGCIGLARIYYYGLGVEQDLHKAFEYFYRVQDAGIASPIADYYLGQSYLLGEGVEQDVGRALFFFERSSREGYFWARWRLARIAIDERRFVHWLRIRASLFFLIIRIAAGHGMKAWHMALPTSTMGPSPLTLTVAK